MKDTMTYKDLMEVLDAAHNKKRYQRMSLRLKILYT